MNIEGKKLYRIREGRMITGVCTGLAQYFDIDVVLIRIVFVALLLGGGSGLLLYILLSLIIPEEPRPQNPGTNHQPNETQSHTTDPHASHSDTPQADSHEHKAESQDTVKEFVHNMQENAQQIAHDLKTEHKEIGNVRNLVGLVIVAVGILALLNSVTGFSFFRWNLFWPIILIFVGALIIFRKK